MSDAGPRSKKLKDLDFCETISKDVSVIFYHAHLLGSTATASPYSRLVCVCVDSSIGRLLVENAQPLEDSLSAGEPNFPLRLLPPLRSLEPPSGEGFQPFLLPNDSKSSTLQSPSRVGSSASPDSTSRSPVTKVTGVPVLRKWLMHSSNWNLCQAVLSLCLG